MARKKEPPELATRAAPEFDRADGLITGDHSHADSGPQVDETEELARWEAEGGNPGEKGPPHG
jgi:hypothetical protein